MKINTAVPTDYSLVAIEVEADSLEEIDALLKRAIQVAKREYKTEETQEDGGIYAFTGN